MSPEKSRVVRLCMESHKRDRCCASILECRRPCYTKANALKRLMKNIRARDKTSSRRRTRRRSWLCAEGRRREAGCLPERYYDFEDEWNVQNSFRAEVTIRCLHSKIARLERLLCDAVVVSGECVCGTYISGSFKKRRRDFECCESPVEVQP